MSTINQVRDFFLSVQAADRELLEKISETSAEIYLEDGQLIFSLHGLHRFLDQQPGLDFKGFKKLLYGSQLNQQLGESGACIELFRSAGKIRTSLYCLKRIDSA